MYSSLYIATFESFKDYIIDTVKMFYNNGIADGKFTFSQDYKLNVVNKDKSIQTATLLWLKDLNAINQQDIEIYNNLKQYRNKLAHELMTLLFEGLPIELPEKFSQLIQLRIKIEKWWILNIEIPTNPDFDLSPEIKEEDIMTSSEIFNKIILDMLSNDEKKASYYQYEFRKKFNK
jgi:hypothetical protein